MNGIPWDLLREEKWRLRTFAKYPRTAAKYAILLAADGFAYTGNDQNLDDKVICVFCKSVKDKWQPFDVIREVHKQLSPVCPIVVNANCLNVPVVTSHNFSLFEKLYKAPSGEVKNNNQPSSTSHITPAAPDISGVCKNNVSSCEGISAHTSPRGETTGILQPVCSSTIVAQSSTETNQLTPANTLEVATNSSVHDLATATPSLTVSAPIAVETAPAADNTVSSTSVTVPSGQAFDTSSVTSGPSPGISTLSTVGNPSQNDVKAKGNSRGPTHSELGIVTERPKRFEYAVLMKRMETFLPWPRDYHLRPKELAEAGFYYAGFGDCCRCFYCGGGIRNWVNDDDAWVEHARFFPKCQYIRQQMGQVFVDTVQILSVTYNTIPFKMVMDHIGDAALAFQLDSKDNRLKRDPAVKTMVDIGYPQAEVIAIAESIKEDGGILSADGIYEKLVAGNIKKSSGGINASELKINGEYSSTDDAENLEKKIRSLKEQNNRLRNQTVCKICLDKEVTVVFLPCGHLVSCTDCASAMKDCPVCRKHVKGLVRALMG